ncbi:hypothetical protein Tco_0603635 [Tanacetum coccineum]
MDKNKKGRGLSEIGKRMIELNADVTKSSRLRLFLFPNKPESVTSIGSLLENSTKSEDWFLNALNGTTSGFSDTSSVNCLLGLDDDVLGGSSLQPNDNKKDPGLVKVNSNVGINNVNVKIGGGQDVHSVPDLERTSSFGSASSSPSLASLPPIRVHVEEGLRMLRIIVGRSDHGSASRLSRSGSIQFQVQRRCSSPAAASTDNQQEAV